MQAEYKILKENAAKKPLDRGQLSIVRGDMSNIRGNGSSMRGATHSLNIQISNVQEKTSNLLNSWQNVQNLKASTNITKDDVTTIVNSANGQIDESQLLLNNAQEQSATYENQATQFLDQADKFVSGLQTTN